MRAALAGLFVLSLGCGQSQPQGGTAFPMTGMPGMPMAGGDFLQNRMNEIYARFGQGRQPVSPLFRGNLATGQTQDSSVTLMAGHCYTLIGVGAATVTDLDLFLFDQNGTQVAQDQATDNFPIVTNCPPVGGAYRVQAKMFTGSGEFGLQVFGS